MDAVKKRFVGFLWAFAALSVPLLLHIGCGPFKQGATRGALAVPDILCILANAERDAGLIQIACSLKDTERAIIERILSEHQAGVRRAGLLAAASASASGSASASPPARSAAPSPAASASAPPAKPASSKLSFPAPPSGREPTLQCQGHAPLADVVCFNHGAKVEPGPHFRRSHVECRMPSRTQRFDRRALSPRHSEPQARPSRYWRDETLAPIPAGNAAWIN
jgi:hypothetical protein